MKTPWCQIKVGFDCSHIDYGDDGDTHFYETIRAANLPEGWELNETYHSPIAYILIFEVEGKEVTKADGEAVQAVIDAYRKPKRRKR